ncbi:unnamed protein product [Moneuplotes crassus]|uniref:Insulin-degrading enzyme n=1 Tax=Euplotes crassus TaxID=5936 RepID=A0AAD1UAN6_EUPCR|nr:unnamed protein product [Moneuplotes crassus]
MNIFRGKTDQNLYKFLKLKNNLSCILVSDQEADKSSVCLSVEVGSVIESKDWQGLAHFCEHMLFLGTEKYPSESYYSKFITEHGGSKNAATSFTNTYYYFDVANDHLEEATDIFSQFFKQPLFDESCVDREINAVDSEFRKNYQNDYRKALQVMKYHGSEQMSNYSKFQTGNLDTLGKPGVRDALMDFHSKYYSSNLMNVCIVGNESLENLEKIAIENFENIEDKDIELGDRSMPHPYPPEYRRKMHKIVPTKDIRELELKFILPSTKKMYNCKPGSYISHVLGHEGKDSLLSFLIQEGLVTELVAGNNHILEACDEFSISISLTQKGEEEVEKVIKIIFSAINELKATKPEKFVFDEMVAMNKINFDYKSRQNPISLAKSLACRINKLVSRGIDMEYLLYYPYMLEEFDEQAIQDKLNEMTPENLIMVYISKAHEGKTDQIEKIYDTPFSTEEIDPGFLEELSSISFDQIGESSLENSHLGFYQNEFIPYNAQLLDEVEEQPVIKINLEEGDRMYSKI